MSAVYMLTMRQLTGRWRLVIMTVLAAMPVLITIVVLRSSSSPTVREFEDMLFSSMMAGAIIPLVVLAIAAAAFANEVEDRTLANLTLSSIPRWQIAVPKLLASISIAAPFVLASAWVCAHFAFLSDWTATVAVVVGAAAAVVMYAAAFVWLGLVSTQAIGAGLLYIVVWEGLFAGGVAGARMLSIRYHAMSLMNGIDGRRFEVYDHPSLAVSVAVSAAVVIGFTLLTVRRLRRMDVP